MSIKVFRSFLKEFPDGTIDASGVISRACYEAFFLAKCDSLKDTLADAKKFYRVLTTHISGVDGRRPFSANEEMAILKLLRKNQHWPCFPKTCFIGTRVRVKGYHEKENESFLVQQTTLPSAVSSISPSVSSLPLLEQENKRVKLEQEQQEPRVVTPCLPAEHILTQDADQFLPVFANKLVHFGASFHHFGIDVWESIFGIVRFVILAKTPGLFLEVTKERAQLLCERMGEEHVNAMVLVLDLTMKNFAHRVRGQNEASRRVFGNLVNDHNGMMMRSDDLHDMLVHGVGSYFSVGVKSRAVCQKIRTVNQREESFMTTYCVDPETNLLVAVCCATS